MDVDLMLIIEALRLEIRALSLKDWPDGSEKDSEEKEAAKKNADFLANQVLQRIDIGR